MNHQECDLYEDNKIYRQFRSFFDLGGRTYELANKCADEIPQLKEDRSEKTLFLDVISRLYFSSFKTYISVLILSNKGHGEDASSLSRSIFENYLTLKYIQLEPQINIYRFMNYPVLEGKSMLDLAKQPDNNLHPSVRELYLQKESSIMESYKQVKHFYVEPTEDENKCLKKFDYGKWARIGKRKMAELVGLTSDYDCVFKHHSCYVHPHAYTLRSFREETKSEILYGAKPSNEGIFSALLTAIMYFLLMLKEDTLAFGLDKEKEIKNLLAELEQLQSNYLKNKGFKK